ncbi:MAG: NAD-dependent epimerase/dehydratase family protein [Halocynthiibacter sp.]
MQTALVTGSAGFIGFHLSEELLKAGYKVIGFDAMTDYYDVSLKEDRHAHLQKNYPAFIPIKDRLEREGALTELMAEHKPDLVVHFAAQAGVRYSIENPGSYVEANLIGTFRLLEAARTHPPAHMLLASTSSAYGANTEMPYSETQRADHQVSFYAATKKANEAMAHSYAHLYNLPVTMFRFFTVYGPWGRPDMALFKFTRSILKSEEIGIYNHGNMQRDFTYVDDLIVRIKALLQQIPVAGRPVSQRDSLSPVAPWRVVNIGTGTPQKLPDFIVAIEESLGQKARRNYMNMQPGDVHTTWADTGLLTDLIGEKPVTDIQVGVEKFISWYRDYYDV